MGAFFMLRCPAGAGFTSLWESRRKTGGPSHAEKLDFKGGITPGAAHRERHPENGCKNMSLAGRDAQNGNKAAHLKDIEPHFNRSLFIILNGSSMNG